MPNLLIFGDSWASSVDCIDTWPELIGQRWRWQLLNLAEPHSGSNRLNAQLRTLCESQLARDSITADDIAIIHTGGNDLYFCPPSSLAAVAASGAACSVCPSRVATALSRNLQSLIEGLITLGIRRYALSGVPLSARMPFIKEPVEQLNVPGASTAATWLMRWSNRALLSAMRSALDSASTPLECAVCLDEATAIDEALDCAESTNMWEDISHPSQALHTALADAFAPMLRAAMQGVAPRQKGPLQAASAGEVELLLPRATPREREAM